MDNDHSININDIVSTLRTADVVILRFVSVGQRLLLDFRTTDLDGPFVGVVDPVRSVDERYRELRKIRPRFSPPERIYAIWWPRFVSSLATTGIWEHVVSRVAESGHFEAVRTAEETLGRLSQLEREFHRQAIRGDGFRTLWSASRAAR